MNMSTQKTVRSSASHLPRHLWLAPLWIVSGLGFIGGQVGFAQVEPDLLETSLPEPVPSVSVQVEEAAPVEIPRPAVPEPVYIDPPVQVPDPVQAEPYVAPSIESTEGAGEIVRPTNLVPAEIPSIPEGYNSVFVDPTDYSIGATTVEAAPEVAPEIVVTERSSGCQFSVGGNRALPDAVCAQPNGQAAAVAQGDRPAASVSDRGQFQSASRLPEPSVNIGPVSFSSAGIRISDNATAQSRAYYNKAVRPIVNLQIGRNFIFPLSAPAPITSLFGWRLHPISGDQRFHTGTDIGAPSGTPVLAAQAGRVAAAESMGGYGLTVVLRHGEKEDLESLYPHLSQLLVEPGEQVEQGEVVGLVGSTGNSTGPHLHFEMRQLTADGWVTLNTNDLLNQSVAKLVQTLNNPLLALSNQAEQTDDSGTTKLASEVLQFFTARPAQPNAN